jgi:hypothetical protein
MEMGSPSPFSRCGATSHAQVIHNWGIVLYINRSLQREESIHCFGLHIAELQSWSNSSATIHTWSQLSRVLRDWVHVSIPGTGSSPEFLTQASVEMRTRGIFLVLSWIILALNPWTNFMTLLPLPYNHVMWYCTMFWCLGCYKASNSLATSFKAILVCPCYTTRDLLNRSGELCASGHWRAGMEHVALAYSSLPHVSIGVHAPSVNVDLYIGTFLSAQCWFSMQCIWPWSPMQIPVLVPMSQALEIGISTLPQEVGWGVVKAISLLPGLKPFRVLSLGTGLEEGDLGSVCH